MTRRQQRGVSLFPTMWNKLQELYPKLGYSSLNNVGVSNLVERFIAEGLKAHENMLSSPLSDKLQKEMQIGVSAERRRSRKWAVANAAKDLEEDEEGIRLSYKRGLITKEQCDEQLTETYNDHYNNAQLELSKKYNANKVTTETNSDSEPEKNVEFTAEESKHLFGVREPKARSNIAPKSSGGYTALGLKKIKSEPTFGELLSRGKKIKMMTGKR